MTRAPAGAPLPPVALFNNHWAPTLAFARSLGRRSVPLHVYGKGAANWSKHCTRHFPCPAPENAEIFLPWLRERVRGGDITRVAPTTDLIAYYISSLREDFPAEVRRTIAPLSEIESVLIKPRFARCCEEIGQPVPPSCSPGSLAEALQAARELQYPLIIKPKAHIAVGFAERGCVIRDEQALREHFRAYSLEPGQESIGVRYPELRWPLMQRYLPSAQRRVYSVSGFKDADAGIVAASLSFKCEQWPAQTGTSTSQVSHCDDRILQAGLRTVDRLITCGIFELELVAGDDEFLAIDLNPRAFGFINLDIALGRDLPWLWFRSTMGAIDRCELPDHTEVIEARQSLMHFLIRLAKWRSRSSRAPADLPGHGRPQVQIPLIGSWSDPLPLLIANAKLLRYSRGVLRSVAR